MQQPINLRLALRTNLSTLILNLSKVFKLRLVDIIYQATLNASLSDIFVVAFCRFFGAPPACLSQSRLWQCPAFACTQCLLGNCCESSRDRALPTPYTADPFADCSTQRPLLVWTRSIYHRWCRWFGLFISWWVLHASYPF